MVSIKQSKFIKSLKIKKYRTKEKCFIIEGRKNVLEAIESNYTVRYLLATSDFLHNNTLPSTIVKDVIIKVDSNTLTELGTFQTNNDCLAVVEMPEQELAEVPFNDHLVVLDGVSDPGNMGTIIRTMDWFGLKYLICSQDSADVYNPKVVNATMGSFARVRVIYTDISRFISDAPIPSFGADLEGIPPSQWSTQEPVMLVMGSESHGLSPEVKAVISGKVSIPKVEMAESLNVAIATGILCHHLRFNLS